MTSRRFHRSSTSGTTANLDPGDQAAWIETTATITTCRYQCARLNTLTLGVPTTRRFRLTFDYYAHGQLRSGEFEADRYVAQDTQIPIRYNPLHPEENNLTGTSGQSSSNSLPVFGVLGSLLFSFLWLAFVRGCN